MTDIRKQMLARWAGSLLDINPPSLAMVSGDASFRRYFRFMHKGQSIIAVDSPPTTENNAAFLQIGIMLKQQGINVPEFLHHNLTDGLFLLSDLGDRLYLPELTEYNAEEYYALAIKAMIKLQQISQAETQFLPRYDEARLTTELELFNQWFIDKHLNLVLSDSEKNVVQTTFQHLVVNAITQPQVLVHRDFHSRNLMVSQSNTPAIIDFQDAVIGPISYDLVSLLKDCYISWPTAKIHQWVSDYYQQALSFKMLEQSLEQFYEHFEKMGMQRHIKVLGIFSRLNHRDNKPNYLKDIPLTFIYLLDAASRYPEFASFHALLQNKIQPALLKLKLAEPQ